MTASPREEKRLLNWRRRLDTCLLFFYGATDRLGQQIVLVCYGTKGCVQEVRDVKRKDRIELPRIGEFMKRPAKSTKRHVRISREDDQSIGLLTTSYSGGYGPAS